MCTGRGEVLVLTSFAMVFLMDIFALQEFSHHGQTCEGQPIRQEDADGWSAGISNLLAIHSAEEVIASTTTCKVPHCLEIQEQVRSGQQPDQQVCIFTFVYFLMFMNLIKYSLHTYIHTYIHAYIHTVHIVHSLHLTVFEIRRELAVRQQQMDDE